MPLAPSPPPPPPPLKSAAVIGPDVLLFEYVRSFLQVAVAKDIYIYTYIFKS